VAAKIWILASLIVTPLSLMGSCPYVEGIYHLQKNRGDTFLRNGGNHQEDNMV